MRKRFLGVERHWLAAAAVVLAGLVIGGLMLVAWRAGGATLTVQNATDHPVTIGVDTRLRKEVPANSTATLELGLFGRWGSPGSILISGAVIAQGAYECSWREVKAKEPLVIDQAGPHCTNIFPPFPPQ